MVVNTHSQDRICTSTLLQEQSERGDRTDGERPDAGLEERVA
jgi:hypothetical protein